MNKPKDKILKRNPFRWTLNGEVCRWCNDSVSLEYVLMMHELILVEKLDNDTAFVRGILK